LPGRSKKEIGSVSKDKVAKISPDSKKAAVNYGGISRTRQIENWLAAGLLKIFLCNNT
jgi:hypothetical protein